MAGSIFKIWIQIDEKVETEKEDENDTLVSFESSTLLERVELLLKQHNITYINQSETLSSKEEKNGKQILIQVFVSEDLVEDVLLELQKRGVGVRRGSGVSVISTVVNYFAKEETEEASIEQSVDTSKHTKEAHIDKFYNSIKSRLIVAEVIKR